MNTALRLAAITGLFATTALSAGSAQAADGTSGAMTYPDGLPYYVEVRLGAPLPRDYNFSGTFTGRYDPDGDFFIAGGVGKYFMSNVRGDITVSYGRGSNGTAYAPGPVPHTGSVSATSVLANGYYEFGEVFPGVTPFVGAGAGVTFFNYDNLGGGTFFNGTANAATVAGHLGIDYALTDMIDLTGRYSLTWTGSHSVTTGPNTLNSAAHTNNIFTVGLRVKFGK